MRERPILFSAPMVRAILEGRKTQTRRVVTEEWNHGLAASEHYPYKKREFQRRDGKDDFVTFSAPYSQMFGEPIWFYSWGNTRWLRCPYGVPGDRLWVRETWQYVDETGEADKSESLRNRLGKTAPFRGVQGNRPITWRAVYRADGEAGHPQYGPIVWRPSTHMPRWASRITLEIKSARVERAQEISEEDARAEGVEKAEATDGALSYVLGFSDLWDSINAKRGYGWHTNPWVWAVEFERVD